MANPAILSQGTPPPVNQQPNRTPAPSFVQTEVKAPVKSNIAHQPEMPPTFYYPPSSPVIRDRADIGMTGGSAAREGDMAAEPGYFNHQHEQPLTTIGGKAPVNPDTFLPVVPDFAGREAHAFSSLVYGYLGGPDDAEYFNDKHGEITRSMYQPGALAAYSGQFPQGLPGASVYRPTPMPWDNSYVPGGPQGTGGGPPN